MSEIIVEFPSRLTEREKGMIYGYKGELIRCKDCKHRDAEDGSCKGRGWPIQLVPDDGFCDKGERTGKYKYISREYLRRLLKEEQHEHHPGV